MDGGRGLPDGRMGPSATRGQAEPKSRKHLISLAASCFRIHTLQHTLEGVLVVFTSSGLGLIGRLYPAS